MVKKILSFFSFGVICLFLLLIACSAPRIVTNDSGTNPPAKPAIDAYKPKIIQTAAFALG